MTTTKFAVITRVPDPTKDRGNLGALIAYKVSGDEVNPFMAPSFFQEVFSLGEIIVVDEWGREIGGVGRKPSKWGVESEVFSSVGDAVVCSNRVLEKYYTYGSQQ